MSDEVQGSGRLEFHVPSEDAGERLDLFLARRMPQCSRSQIQRWIRSGAVEVNSRNVEKAGERLAQGDSIRVRPERNDYRAAPEAIALKIAYEDEDMAVVDKPAGMVVHAGAGVRSGTLVNALLHHLGGGLSSLGGELRPGIVHRLDKMTSGLILVAKNDAAHRSLAEQFRTRRVHKRYLALVHGRMQTERGAIRASVGRDHVRRVRMRIGGIAARDAVTEYRAVRHFPNFTLLDAQPRTGRTHQIRVHLAAIRHPVVGDTVYGAPAKLCLGGREQPSLERNFLHAAEIRFAHPRTGAELDITSPLPPELADFLDRVSREDR